MACVLMKCAVMRFLWAKGLKGEQVYKKCALDFMESLLELDTTIRQRPNGQGAFRESGRTLSATEESTASILLLPTFTPLGL